MEKKLALPMGKIRVPFFLYLIAVFLIVLILFVLSFNFVVNKYGRVWENKKTTKTAKVETETNGQNGGGSISSINRKEISRKLMVWLEEQRDITRKVYSENEFCENGICKGKHESNRSGFSVMAGEVRYEKKINQHIIDDLKRYSDRDKVQIIQSNYLLCNFLYDLYSYPNASSEAKDLSEKLCFDVNYEIFDKDYKAIYKENIDTEKLLEQNLQKLKQVVESRDGVNSVSESDFNILSKYGFYASEFATRYKWKKDEDDYRGFLVSLDGFLGLYENNRNEFKDGEVCGMAWGLIDMGEVKNLSELKEYGKKIYLNEISGSKIKDMSLRQMLTCGLVAEKLKMRDVVENVLATATSNFYNKKHGSLGEQFHNFETNVYDVKNNGIFLMLLNSDIIGND